MRVHDQHLSGASTPAADRSAETQRTEHAGNTSAASRQGSDHVELSHALGAISRALKAEGSGRAAHVQELAIAFQSGRYRPDAAATSRSMVAEALG
jgi:hypothetical protein